MKQNLHKTFLKVPICCAPKSVCSKLERVNSSFGIFLEEKVFIWEENELEYPMRPA